MDILQNWKPRTKNLINQIYLRIKKYHNKAIKNKIFIY